MQTVALMNALSALTFALAPAALSKDDGKNKELKTDLPPYNNLGLNSYDLHLDSYGEIIDLNNYEDIYDYGDLAPKIEVGTLAPPTKEFPQPLSTAAVPVKVPQSKPSSSPAARTKGPGLLGSITNQGLPTCLICVCIRSSVYCDDTELENIPPLPFETTYFYARFNRINRIQANDFIGLSMLCSFGILVVIFRCLQTVNSFTFNWQCNAMQSYFGLAVKLHDKKYIRSPFDRSCKVPWDL